MPSPLGLFRALFGRLPQTAERPRSRLAARLGVEALDDRIMPAFDIAMYAAGLASPTTAGFLYTSTGPATTVTVNVFRSADPVFDAGDELVGGNTITTSAAGGIQIGFAGLNGQLPLDPARHYVLVVADPGGAVTETDETNNTASFRKIALGAVTHGFSATGNPAEWLVPFAQQMQAEGYDFVLPYIWAPLSQTPTPNGTVVAGQNLAQFVRAAAAILATGPFDVVDVHLIGHSRGTAVVSQAFQSLTLNPGPRPLQFGFFKETLLDPHVARNFAPLAAGLGEMDQATGTVAASAVGQFSFNPSSQLSQVFGRTVLSFQAAAMDPPAFVPAAVDQAEVYFQRLPWNQSTYVIPGQTTTFEQSTGLNFLGTVPVANPFLRPVQYIDLGPMGVGHFEVPDWYLANVVPTLGS